jgi:hypothetical protein
MQQMSQQETKCSERDETERDIPLMDLLDRWESSHKIQDSRFNNNLGRDLCYCCHNLIIIKIKHHKQTFEKKITRICTLHGCVANSKAFEETLPGFVLFVDV